MGCGCGGQPARRPMRNIKPAIANAAKNNSLLTPEQKEAQAYAEERQKIEKRRREAILRALGRP
jgi:hypothetical protein